MALLPEPISPEEEQEEEPQSLPPPPPEPKRAEVPSKKVETPKPPSLKKPSRKIKILALIVFIIIPILAGYLFWTSRKGGPSPQIAAKVGKEKITLEEVGKLAEDCSLSQKEAVEYIVDEKVLDLWAKDEKIEISQDEQKQEETRLSGREATLSATKSATINCVTLEAKVNLLREKLSQNIHKFREGKFIVVNFDRYLQKAYFKDPTVENEEDRKKKLEEEKSYTDLLISSIYSDLNSKKMTFEQAMEKVLNDEKVGKESWYKTSLQSGIFNATDYIEQKRLLSNENVKKKIDSLEKDQFSEPFGLQLAICDDPEPNCQPKYVDARWLIIKVEQIGKGYGGTEEELLKKTREHHKAAIYLK